MTCPRRLPSIAPFLLFTLFAIAACGKEPLGSNNPDGGSGGVTGSGGAQGSGGSSGTGGNQPPLGGTGGSADAAVDHPADASSDCSGLLAEYEAAFKEAKKCDPLSGGAQCLPVASQSLPCPGCTTHVQSAIALDQIRARWDRASCRGPTVICPAIRCPNPGAGVCTPSAAGGGVCGDS